MNDVWIIGAHGQLGHALVEIYGARARAFTRDDLNLDDPGAAIARLRDLPKPRLIFNASAYTQVDRAETDREACARLNVLAPAALAGFAHEVGADFYHYSTDFVFSGEGDEPWSEHAPTGPLNVYGATKLAGEAAVLEMNPNARILRTSWVYSYRRANFPLAILKRARETMTVTVVTDQIGSPTYAVSLAELSAKIAGHPATAETAGIYHLADSGYVSRYDFAREIVAIATRFEMDLVGVKFVATTTAAQTAAARRPLNSRLDLAKVEKTFGIRCPDWRDNLRTMIRRHYERR